MSSLIAHRWYRVEQDREGFYVLQFDMGHEDPIDATPRQRFRRYEDAEAVMRDFYREDAEEEAAAEQWGFK